MIYDKLANIENYLGISPNLDTAIRYLSAHDPASLPLGKTEVDGDLVYINVMEAQASPAEERGFEIHKHYMDIQIDLSGTEIIETGDAASMTVTDYSPETDFGKVQCPVLASCVMGCGNFILCMASEPHRPGITAHLEDHLKKCVVKVHI